MQDWRGLDLDFSGAVFDGGDFRGAEFSGGTVDFSRAEFSRGGVVFEGAEFSGGKVDFRGADWSVPPRFPGWDSWPQGVQPPDGLDE